MKRILHCLPTLGGGGAEGQLLVLADQLGRRGWDVHLAMFAGGPWESRIPASLTVHRLPVRSSYDPRLITKLYRLMTKLAPQLVQTWLSLMDVAGGTAALARRVPWIATERSCADAYDRSAAVRLRRLIASRATALVANSIAGADYWRPLRRRKTLDRVIPNSVAFARLSSLPATPPEDLHLPAGRPLAIYVGRLSREKNIDALLEASARAMNEIDHVLVLCGDGPLRAATEAKIDALGIAGRVRLLGFVPDVPRVIRAADVFVSLSTFEGMPNAVQEAMACGTPMVLSDIVGHRALASDSALYVAADDPAATARALVEVIAGRNGVRDRVAAAQRRASQWTPEHMADAYEELYEKVLQRHAG